MSEKALREQVLRKAKDGKLACRAALSIAYELGISPRKVGEMADELNIKIIDCQLGCFGNKER